MSLVRFRFWAFQSEVGGIGFRGPVVCGCSSMVEHQPSKLDTWVRFPSPAFGYGADILLSIRSHICDSGVVGNARPCQGRDRGFEPRLSLFRPGHIVLVFCCAGKALVSSTEHCVSVQGDNAVDKGLISYNSNRLRRIPEPVFQERTGACSYYFFFYSEPVHRYRQRVPFKINDGTGGFL